MRYKMLVLDLDDSLLSDDLTISQANKEAIWCAVDNGVQVTIATGRMFKATLPYIEQLKINVPVITYNGALVLNSISQETILHCPVPLDITKEIIDDIEKIGVHLQLYIDDEYYFKEHNKYSRYYKNLVGVDGFAVGFIDKLTKVESTKLIIIDEPKSILKLKDRYCRMFEGKLQITISKPMFLEFTHIDATKGNAIEYLSNMHGIERNDIIAVGDSYNDISMIKYAGLGVAMGNAPQIVKDAADFVTLSNEHNGVANVIEKFILKGEG